MALLRSLARKTYGAITPTLKGLIAADIDRMVEEMLTLAIQRWRASGWQRFDDLEINCTIQLFRWSEEAIDHNRGLESLSVQLEWVQPTPEMIAGLETAVTLRRPDLRVSVGRYSGRSIECKRLSLRNGHPRRYVNDGMDRFVSGGYGNGEAIGFLAGFIQRDEPNAIVTEVNTVVTTHPRMGPADQLEPVPTRGGGCQPYESHHSGSIGPPLLRHYLIDFQS